jgi:hypothetical protein
VLSGTGSPGGGVGLETIEKPLLGISAELSRLMDFLLFKLMDSLLFKRRSPPAPALNLGAGLISRLEPTV